MRHQTAALLAQAVIAIHPMLAIYLFAASDAIQLHDARFAPFTVSSRQACLTAAEKYWREYAGSPPVRGFFEGLPKQGIG